MRNYQGDPGLFSALKIGALIFKKIRGRKKTRRAIPDLPVQARRPGGFPLMQTGILPSRGSPFGLLSKAMRGSPFARMEEMAIQKYASGFVPTPRGGVRTTPSPADIAAMSAGMPKRKRMNVANPKALRRAIRRQSGFVKLARKALKGSGYRIVSAGSRRPGIKIQEAGRGGVVVQK